MWGLETIIDMKECDPNSILDENIISQFIETLMDKIEMVPLWPLILQYCHTTDPLKKGWTFVQVIQDSNVTGHLVDHDNSGYLNVFSCKPYDPSILKEVVKQFFNPKEVNYTIVQRG